MYRIEAIAVFRIWTIEKENRCWSSNISAFCLVALSGPQGRRGEDEQSMGVLGDLLS
jgi:hypothetical protein